MNEKIIIKLVTLSDIIKGGCKTKSRKMRPSLQEHK